jgi:hypothetical protein
MRIRDGDSSDPGIGMEKSNTGLVTIKIYKFIILPLSGGELDCQRSAGAAALVR